MRRKAGQLLRVLHDLNHASRFSDYMIAMKNGELITEGTPEEVMTCPNLQLVFNIEASLPFVHLVIIQFVSLINCATRICNLLVDEA